MSSIINRLDIDVAAKWYQTYSSIVLLLLTAKKIEIARHLNRAINDGIADDQPILNVDAKASADVVMSG